MAENNNIHVHTFYENVTSTDEITTSIMAVDCNASEMNISFNCEGTFSAKIYASIINKTKFYGYPCFKLPTYELITDTITDDNFLYNLDITGVDYIKIVLTSLTSSISIFGNVVG